MKNFIEVTDEKNKKHLINIRHIEEVVECDDDKCFIYLDVVSGETQDYYTIRKPYETIKLLTMQKEGADNESERLSEPVEETR